MSNSKPLFGDWDGLLVARVGPRIDAFTLPYDANIAVVQSFTDELLAGERSVSFGVAMHRST